MENSYYIKELGKSVALIVGFTILLIMAMLVASVSAYDVYGVADNNTIRWNWSYENVDKISVDGALVSAFVPNSTEYQITFDKEQYPTSHKIILFEDVVNVGENITTTSYTNSSVTISDILAKYILLFIGILIIFVAVKTNIVEFVMISFLLGIVGIALYQTEFITEIIYGILALVSVGITFKE